MQNRCGSCGAWLTPGAEVCDTCHHRAGASGGAGRVDLDDPLRGGGDLLELELDLPVEAPARRPARPAAHDGFDADPLDPLGASAGGAALELDLAAPVRNAPPAPVAPGGAAERRRTAAPAATARGMALYDVEVQSLADYGRAPDGIFGAIPYTLHVLSRRSQLKAALSSATTMRQGAEAAARRALVDLGRELLSRAGTLDLGQVSAHLEAARRVAGELDERATAASAERGEIEQRSHQLDARVREAQADANPWRDKETKLRTQLETRDATLKRATAQLRRAEIEIRNAVQQAEQAGQPPDPDRLAALEAEREARTAEVAVAEGPVRELTRELGDIRRELASRLAAIKQIEDERRAADDALRRLERLHAAGTGAASRELEEALLALGEEAHLRGLDQPLGPAAAKAEATLAALGERQRSEELHRRALDAYDKPAFKKGAAILGGAALAVLVTLLFVIVR